MKIMYFEFRTEEEMATIERELKKRGYRVVNPKENITFKAVQEHYRRNKVYLIKAYYNNINNRYEYKFSTRQIEKRRGKMKKENRVV